MNTYYFAYGSNLHLEQMSRRCPLASPVTLATLPDYRLVFRLHADIEPAEGHSVEGGIYRITPSCRRALDRYEGVMGGYYERATFEHPELGEVMFYQMVDRGRGSTPTEGYLATCIQGAADWGIPPFQWLDAAEDTWA